MCDDTLEALKARIEAQNFLIGELLRENREMKSLVKFVERENARIRKRNADLHQEKSMLEKELDAFAELLPRMEKTMEKLHGETH